MQVFNQPLTHAERERYAKYTAEKTKDDYIEPPYDTMLIEAAPWKRIQRPDLIREGLLIPQGEFEKQDDLKFKVIDRNLRGRFNVLRVCAFPRPEAMNAILRLPECDGIWIGLHRDEQTKRATGYLFDPLSLSEKRKILAEYNAITRMLNETVHEDMVPWKTEVFPLSDEDGDTWELEMSQLLEDSAPGCNPCLVRPIRNCEKLRSTLTLKLLGTCRVTYLDPEGLKAMGGVTHWSSPELKPRAGVVM
jgi:hypothetical protein